MSKAYWRTFDCIDCGALTRRKLKWDTDKRCIECSINAACKSVAEMHCKSGPAYDKFMKSDGRFGRPRKTLG